MKFFPHTDEERSEMLAALKINSIDDLFREIPEEIKLKRPLNLPKAFSELELTRHLDSLAGANKTVDQYVCFLGAGAYDHYIPSAVKHILSRAEYYTAYTPYQPEISQAVLQSIFEYQTMICELTGMDISNASMYDGASAMAEAALMAAAAARRNKVLVSRAVHLAYREVLLTYADGHGLEVEEIPVKEGRTDFQAMEKQLTGDAAAVIIAYPNFFGVVEDLTTAAELAHRNKSLFIAVCDPVSLGVLKAPGSCGADIVVGDGQSLGIPLSYGGPYLGYMACTNKLLRRMPGRIVGQTKDNQGRRGFVLTLQAREQHIRREKATSNICSNQALCALAATVHLSLLGRQGFKQAAEQCLQKAHYAYKEIVNLLGYSAAWQAPFFKEFVVKVPQPPAEINAKLLDDGIIGGLDLAQFYPELENHMLFCVTEKRTKAEIDRLTAVLGGDAR